MFSRVALCCKFKLMERQKQRQRRTPEAWLVDEIMELNFTMILDMVYSILIIHYFKIGTSLPFPIQGASARFSIF